MGKKQTTRRLRDAEDIEIKEQQEYARMLGSCGNNQHEVERIDGEKLLVTLQPQFRRLVWIKPGHFVIVEPIKGTASEKVYGEIVNVLLPEHVKALEKAGKWPAEFSQKQSPKVKRDELEGSDSDDEHLFVNNNRPIMSETDESSSDEDSDEADRDRE